MKTPEQKRLRRKLTEKDVLEIREIAANTSRTQLDISWEYPAHQTTISKIIRRKTWKHI